MNDWSSSLFGAAGVLIGTMVTYLTTRQRATSSKRLHSGDITTSDADVLWLSMKDELAAVRTENTYLRDTMTALQNENADLRKENAELRRDLTDRINTLMVENHQKDRIIAELKDQVATMQTQLSQHLAS